ncbi:transporter [uncultured Algibacter sp.]|uniref:transporter n=1 Tax=uncultured Algibacter sp. TaxID=298659 RepID=UPI003217FD6C
MKLYKIIFIGFLCLLPRVVLGQTISSCTHCSMAINDQKFIATAIGQNSIVLEFDAIECLINYQKTEKNIHTLKVTDFNTGVLINATTAFYVKSYDRPSPMGAFLSAYASKDDALQVSSGSVMNWTALLAKFKGSSYGAVEHSHHNHHRSDAHGPIGIMGDHLHPKGGVMVSFRVMHMAMDGNRRGSDKIENQDIFQDFMVAPQDMTMQMYMLGVMYAPSDELTLMLMQSFATKQMNLTAQMMMSNGMIVQRDFETQSSGIGDLKIGALYSLWSTLNTTAHLNSTFNIPIGDIKNRDNTPTMKAIKLPYAMQLGSGTFDVTIGATIKGNTDNLSWGIQQLNTIRTGRNSEDYRFGNLYELNLWGSYSFVPQFSTSLRVQGTSEGMITGIDSELNPMMVTTASTNNYGGEILRSYIGFNGLVNNKLSLGFEIGLPLYQKYNGISMDETLTINAGVKYSIL